jgi:hypothetical protein
LLNQHLSLKIIGRRDGKFNRQKRRGVG